MVCRNPFRGRPFVRGGAELLAGVVQDPVFGPLVAFGPGGVFAELIGEAQFRIAPLTLEDAEELVLTGKAGQLVAGFRGQPAADAEALVDLVLRRIQAGPLQAHLRRATPPRPAPTAPTTRTGRLR